uniref:TonB-dependent receptor plug domain-containing protein n=1 Tax=Roseihalotalea indica TaxID=2867963 RepID=A0AA49GUA5_9BACT|nr:TonB-dependent receptor plug domain-containing protein [Tunicatimonas sp. TK19036]
MTLAFQAPHDDTLARKIVKQLAAYTNTFRQEKLYLHFDKPYYSVGETMWFKTYLVDATTHHPEALSRLAYVELIGPDNAIVERRNLEITESGGIGDFLLGDSLPAGSYTVRAYTNWMRNFDEEYFFRQTIPVVSIDSTKVVERIRSENRVEQESFVYNQDQPPIDLQFFPEGGELVDGLASMVGFKATGPDGQGLAVQGRIIDQNQQTITTFESHKFGMGRFVLKPSSSHTYQAIVELAGIPLTFPLPEVQEQGYIIRATPSLQSDKVRVTVQSKESVKDGVLIGHQRGTTFMSLIMEGDQPYFVMNVSKSAFPGGICHLTFFDRTGTPRCERLLFANYPSDLPELAVKADQSTYSTREEVTLSMMLQDSTQQPSLGYASLTITNASQVTYSEGANTIMSHLLLTSDLRGVVEQPQYYFNERTDQAYEALDNLMLTQGWRRFRWGEVLQDSLPVPEYMAERGFQIKGQMVRYYNRDQPENGQVSMMVVGDSFAFAEGETNESGEFAFVDNQFQDTTEVVIQARRVKGKKEKLKKDVYINLELFSPPPITHRLSSGLSPWLPMMGDYLEQQQKINQIDQAYNFDQKTIVLDEVEVKGRKDDFDNPFRQADQFYGEPSNRLILDSIPGGTSALSVFDLLRRVPGVQVYGAFPNQMASIRGFGGQSEALYLLDGIPVDATMINTISTNDVYYVDVLRGASATMYGSRGGSGVIAVYTRRGPGMESVTERLGIINYTHPGYYHAREFYVPHYDVKKPEHVKPDFRSTLYWEPSVVFGEDGRALVSFYTSDEKAEYQVQVEGVTTNGQPFTQQHSFVVK